MAEDKKETEKNRFWRNMVPKIIRAALKSAIIMLLYFLFFMLLNPFGNSFLGYQLVFDVFVATYIAFIILIELSSGTIFHYAFIATRALFSVLYVILAFDGGVIATNIENIQFTIDLRYFMSIFILLSLLSFVKGLLQAIKFLIDKEERLFSQL